MGQKSYITVYFFLITLKDGEEEKKEKEEEESGASSGLPLLNTDWFRLQRETLIGLDSKGAELLEGKR